MLKPTIEVFNISLNVCEAQSLNKTLNRLNWWMFLEALIIQYSHVSNTYGAILRFSQISEWKFYLGIKNKMSALGNSR